ncbi:MAG: hypothetical protein K0R98_1218 [Rickettsiaceae bacterium]|jgi:hypothetical protein|nr:hypothetical protein [Rickettsiaceae bacterium]
MTSDSYITNYLRKTITDSLGQEPIAPKAANNPIIKWLGIKTSAIKKYHDDLYNYDNRLIAVANIMHYHAGSVNGLLKKVVDTPAHRIEDPIDRNNLHVNVSSTKHVDELINWSRYESIEKDLVYVIDKSKLNDNIIATRSIRKLIRDIYQASFAQDDKALLNAVDKFYNFCLPGTTKPLITAENDVFGYRRASIALGKEIRKTNDKKAEFFKTKVTDNILNHIEATYSAQTSIQNNINFLPTTKGVEILYRGINYTNFGDRMDTGNMHDSFADGIAHVSLDYNSCYNVEDAEYPKRAIFNFGIKTPWTKTSRNTYGVSTGMYLPISLEYGTNKKERANTGYIYIIKPPIGESAMLSAHYNSYASRFKEITPPNIPSEWIEKRIAIQRLSHSHTKYEVIGVEENPFFDKSLNTPERRKLEEYQLQNYKNYKNQVGRLKLHDVFAKGTIIDRGHSSNHIWQSINNSIIAPIKNALGINHKLKKTYVVTRKNPNTGLIEKGLYDAEEQTETYNKYYRKNYYNGSDRYTPKTKKLYRNRKEFEENYTTEEVREHRFQYNHPFEHNLTNKWIRGYRSNYAAWDILEAIGKTDLFSKVKAYLNEISAHYYSSTRCEIHHLDKLHKYQNSLAKKIFGKEYRQLDPEIRLAVHKLVEVAIYNAKEFGIRIICQNRNADISHGLYGGIGAFCNMGSKTINGIKHNGFLVSEVYTTGPSHKKLKKDSLITAIRKDGTWVSTADMSREDFAKHIKGDPGTEVSIKSIECRTEKTHIIKRDFIDATYRERYAPSEHILEKELQKRKPNRHTPLAKEYANRDEHGVKYYNNFTKKLSEEEIGIIKHQKESLKAL